MDLRMVDGGGDSKVAVRLPRGSYSKIARIHRVSPQMVRMVHLGQRKSARLTAAIARYIERRGIAA